MRIKFLSPVFATDDGGALTIDQAVDQMVSAKDPEPAAEVENEQPEPEAEGAEVADAEQVDVNEPEAETADEPEVEPEPAAPAVDAPQWYDAEAKAVFAKLPPEMQAVVKAQEDKRETITQKEKQQAVEARKAASEASETMRGLLTKLQDSIPDEVAAFHARHNYDPQDLERYRHEDPAGYLALQAQIFSERQSLEQKIAAKAEAERVAGETFAREQAQRLKEIEPTLATEQSLRALGDYLPKTGIPAAALKDASAEELIILNKARLWDEAQAKAAASANAPKPKQAPMKTVPPVSAPVVGSSKQRTVQQISNRLSQTGSLDDAIELMMARKA